MKKLVYSASLLALFFVSCSDSGDDNTYTPPPTNGTLLVKTIETDEDGSTLTTNYTYNGSKLVALTSDDDTHTVVNYTGDLITSMVYYDEDNAVEETDTFEYNASGQMIAFYEEGTGDFEIHEKFLYTYNADGTIAVEHYASFGGGDYELSHDGLIYDDKVTENVAAFDGFPVHVDWHEFTYDSKNSPYAMITGFSKIVFAGDRESKNYANNQTSQTHKNTLGVNQPQSNTTYTYNAANYPTTSVETQVEGGATYSTQYFYQ